MPEVLTPRRRRNRLVSSVQHEVGDLDGGDNHGGPGGERNQVVLKVDDVFEVADGTAEHLMLATAVRKEYRSVVTIDSWPRRIWTARRLRVPR